MKIPSSTSFVVTAALIASSSTASLAAPTGAPSDGNGLASGNQFKVDHHNHNAIHAAEEVHEKDEKEEKKEDDGGPLKALLNIFEGVLCSTLKLDCPPEKAAGHTEAAASKEKATRDIVAPRNKLAADTSPFEHSSGSPRDSDPPNHLPRSPPTHSHPL